MFVLSTLEDDVRVEPSELNKEAVAAITSVLEKTYFDKVIPGVGLVVSLYDLCSVEGGFVYPGEGAPRFKVRFRVVVFRPFPGEVLLGRLAKSDTNGLRVALGDWYSDVKVPEHALRNPSLFVTEEKLWVWRYQQEGATEPADLWLDLDEPIRVRVTRVVFNPLPLPSELQGGDSGGQKAKVGTSEAPYVPMEVEASITEDGLGAVSWWEDADADEEA